MEDDTAGSRKRGLFSDVSEEPLAKVARQANPEYKVAFQAFDHDQSGFIDLNELANALRAVQLSVEEGSPRARNRLFPRPFQPTTCCWLCARFGDGARLNCMQFCELLDYLKNLKRIFQQVDQDRSGFISRTELSEAFRRSGVNLSETTVDQVGKSYDTDNSGTLEFDEFVQMRLEWDCYVAAWDRATMGASAIHPEKLLQVLEEIKTAMEPVSQAYIKQGLFHKSMFTVHRPFSIRTCESLIIRFGEGQLTLNFGQFSAMMVLLKELKTAFCQFDIDKTGSLDVKELANCFSSMGFTMPEQLVVQIGQSFDRDNSGGIEFDEFVQLTVEWHEMLQEQARFASERISAKTLQELFGSVRVLYRVRDGAVQTMRRFSKRACRWLVAMFGTPGPGEAFAESLSWNEYLAVSQYLKEAYIKYQSCDISRTGNLNTEELWLALSACNIQLSKEAVENVRRCYDRDHSGVFEFDEFIQLLVECQLYDQCFEARLHQPSILTPLNRSNPMLGVSHVSAASGLITLDKTAFFSMVFAVPRNL
mmetsp:Transcript_38018/g.80500  ORF Transcript_38018/g.80500 Transcript_38018/m.80500 type:complete len:535 (+) Transcript_38018:130-1734(+)